MQISSFIRELQPVDLGKTKTNCKAQSEKCDISGIAMYIYDNEDLRC